jgi:hypothetical protein
MGGSGDREARELSLFITYVGCKGNNVRQHISMCTSGKMIRGRNKVRRIHRIVISHNNIRHVQVWKGHGLRHQSTWAQSEQRTTYHTVPLSEAFSSLQDHEVLVRSLRCMAAVEPSGVIFFVRIVVFIVVIVVNSSRSFGGCAGCVIVPVGHNRAGIRSRSLAQAAGGCTLVVAG